MKKICSKCKKVKNISEFNNDKRRIDGKTSWCRDCINNASRLYWKKQYDLNPRIYAEKQQRWKLQNPDGYKKIQIKSKIKLRVDVLNAYSNDDPKCICCGEKEIKFLALDHINNDGKKDRKEFGWGNAFYFYLRKHNYPDKHKYQILCHNCNMAKQFYGSCPHKN